VGTYPRRKTPQKAERLTGNYYDQIVANVYAEYQKILKANSSLDFDDLIMVTVRLFKEVPEVLEFYQKKFQYIHVDEYQDTNALQARIVHGFARVHRNVLVVGDDAQGGGRALVGDGAGAHRLTSLVSCQCSSGDPPWFDPT
jgi:DNA helicase II / ATP-dependent DNA helicase PcrA